MLHTYRFTYPFFDEKFKTKKKIRLVTVDTILRYKPIKNQTSCEEYCYKIISDMSEDGAEDCSCFVGWYYLPNKNSDDFGMWIDPAAKKQFAPEKELKDIEIKI